MKKIIAALLTLIMAMALFAGCGGDNGENNLPAARRLRASRSAERA